MDTSQPISEKPDLGVVFGELDDDRKARLLKELEVADRRLAGLRETLDERSGRSWEANGISLETYESGQVMLTGVVSDPAEGITFTVELRPGNFFDETRPWHPGDAPRSMATDAWDVEGEVQVQKVTRIEGRKYTVQESAAELPEQRYDRPEAAVAAFASYCDELSELALSREPVAASWQSADEEPSGDDDAPAADDEPSDD